MVDYGDAMRYLRAMTNEMRDERLARFEEKILPTLKSKYEVESEDSGTRYIVKGTPKGTLTIYPKANNMQVHADGSWQKPAVKWLYKNRII